MGHYILDGRVKKWVEDDDYTKSIDSQCMKIYNAVKPELNELCAEGYIVEFIKYNHAWIITLSLNNQKIISFVFQYVNDKLIVYIYTMENRIFLYKKGFMKNAISIIK